MATVEIPAADVVAARVEMTADKLEAVFRQLERGDIPTAELTADGRGLVDALRTAIGRDAQNAKVAALTVQALGGKQ